VIVTSPVPDRADGAPALEVANLDFSYGQLQVLFDISLRVDDGEVLALLGTNGAGKSTLLKAIAGIGRPSRGTVTLFGRPVDAMPAETRVTQGLGLVLGGKMVFPSLSVADNLRLGCYSFRDDAARCDRRTEVVLALFPRLRERIHQTAGSMSGGEQQMLAIGIGMLPEPRMLCIDELSLGLAPIVVQELLGVVEQLAATGVSVLIVEQSVNVALALAGRAVFLEKGRVGFEGNSRDLLERGDLVRAVFLGGTSG